MSHNSGNEAGLPDVWPEDSFQKFVAWTDTLPACTCPPSDPSRFGHAEGCERRKAIHASVERKHAARRAASDG